MRTSESGLALIRQFEGLRLRAYRDAVGVGVMYLPSLSRGCG
jgi:GH24 family phage-related lysozyme (muramidase)